MNIKPSTYILISVLVALSIFIISRRVIDLKPRKPSNTEHQQLQHKGLGTPRTKHIEQEELSFSNKSQAAQLSPQETEKITDTAKPSQQPLTDLQQNDTETSENQAKPTEKDVFSSTVSTTLKEGEVLVTGGYQTADGLFHYSITQPSVIQSDSGQTMISLKNYQYSMSPELVTAIGLDSLATMERINFQHGGIWQEEDLKMLNADAAGVSGLNILSAPQIITFPGNEATIQIGDYIMSTTPELTADGSGFDLELRIEAPVDLQN